MNKFEKLKESLLEMKDEKENKTEEFTEDTKPEIKMNFSSISSLFPKLK